jgi:uncharacterized protein (TIGR02246 family)
MMMSEDERAIRQLVETWMEATKGGDTETVLSLMADDAIFMVPGREPFGKEAFKAAAEGQKDLRIEGRSDICEVKVLADWAYMRSHLEMTMRLADGQMMRRAGYALTILHKTAAGRWVLSRDANLLTEKS